MENLMELVAMFFEQGMTSEDLDNFVKSLPKDELEEFTSAVLIPS